MFWVLKHLFAMSKCARIFVSATCLLNYTGPVVLYICCRPSAVEDERKEHRVVVCSLWKDEISTGRSQVLSNSRYKRSDTCVTSNHRDMPVVDGNIGSAFGRYLAIGRCKGAFALPTGMQTRWFQCLHIPVA